MLLILISQAHSAQNNNLRLNPLTEDEERVIIHKGTEMPFTGKYYNFTENGIYVKKSYYSVFTVKFSL